MKDSLPSNLYLIRHGESEANVLQAYIKGKRDKRELTPDIIESFFDRHDYGMRLSPKGVEQAKIAGEYIKNELNLNPYYRKTAYYVSPMVRACETAYNLNLDANWTIDDRIRERDWGEDGIPTVDLEYRTSDVRKKLKYLNEYYWKPLGGESLATGVRLRFESFRKSLPPINSVLAVAHGELIRVAMSIIENLTPEEYNLYDRQRKIHNTTIFHYTRQNPHNSRDLNLHSSYRWRRVIVPYAPELSWDGGEWVDILPNRTHSDASLAEFVS